MFVKLCALLSFRTNPENQILKPGFTSREIVILENDDPGGVFEFSPVSRGPWFINVRTKHLLVHQSVFSSLYKWQHICSVSLLSIGGRDGRAESYQRARPVAESAGEIHSDPLRKCRFLWSHRHPWVPAWWEGGGRGISSYTWWTSRGRNYNYYIYIYILKFQI